ncbi:MAG: hypothetical protein K8R90_07870 [Candidatus Cloacimonetes bacterium]|nr:hypothetical protein [Candidatus Cloacimonadota bacterium]
MTGKLRLKAFIRSTALLFFFVNFFTSYLLFGSDLVEAFIRGLIVMVITTIVLHAVFAVWAFAFRPGEWRLIITGPPPKPEEAQPLEAEA